MIKQLLNEFWQWMLEELNKTQNDYNENGLNQRLGEFEDDFPKWNELFYAGQRIITKNALDDSSIFDLLTVMGIDNEGENICEDIEDYSSEEQFKKVIEMGLNHPQMETRWQLTQLLENKKPIGYYEKLKFLTQDRAPYVRQRARNSINYIRFGEGWDVIFEKIFARNPLLKCEFSSDASPKPICEFCQNEIGTGKLTVGYSTDNAEFWICKTCYNDCKEGFELKSSNEIDLQE